VKLCYLDESGDTGLLPSATAPIQPVFVIAGLIVNHVRCERSRWSSCN